MLKALSIATYVFNIFDAAMTSLFINIAGIEVELNPFAAWLWMTSPALFWAFKIILPGFFILFCYLVASGHFGNRTKLAKCSIYGFFTAYLILTFWHVYNATLI